MLPTNFDKLQLSNEHAAVAAAELLLLLNTEFAKMS